MNKTSPESGEPTPYSPDTARHSFEELTPSAQAVIRTVVRGQTLEGEIAFPVVAGEKITLLRDDGIKVKFPEKGQIARVDSITPEAWVEAHGREYAHVHDGAKLYKVTYVADDTPLSSSVNNFFWIEVYEDDTNA